MIFSNTISKRINVKLKSYFIGFIIFSFISIFFNTSAYSQNIKSFSTDTAKFIEEFEEYLQRNITDE
nr:hypothetical protein [Bacteroidales bacterium]